MTFVNELAEYFHILGNSSALLGYSVAAHANNNDMPRIRHCYYNRVR